MKIKEDKKIKILIIVSLVILLIILYIYGLLIHRHFTRKSFAEKNMEVYHHNEEKVFKIEKIILCSSANAIDRSKEKNMQSLSIYQYTDIAIYIDNGDALTNKNTISKLYIDNISLEGEEDIGIKSLNYKNTLNFGLKEDIEKPKELENNIDFNIIYTNEQEKQTNYNEPAFFTDCSNPITLEYLNYDLINNYKMEENNMVSFDGSILKKAGISKESIGCKVKFRINIINNQSEKYTCYLNIKIPLDDIYKGTTMKSKETNKEKYVFFRE